MPQEFPNRLQWIREEARKAHPHLLVIDMLWQFVVAKNNNDYNAVIDGINKLQDALLEIAYKGALVVTLHGRKAENPDDSFDDILGSTGQRGSFSTSVMLKRHRKEGIYTVESDQTHRDALHGEIPETILEYGDGELKLGETRSQRAHREKLTTKEEAKRKVLDFIQKHPRCHTTDIVSGLKMAKRTVTNCLSNCSALITRTGAGEKGSPYAYSVEISQEVPGEIFVEVPAEVSSV